MNLLDILASSLGIPGGFSGIFIWAVGIGAILAVGVIIYGGVLYIISAGNPATQKEAKEWIKAAIYGLLLLLGAWLILNTINPTILK
jgi:ABC-type nickel/cobalt efflux system permease component RcnA